MKLLPSMLLHAEKLSFIAKNVALLQCKFFGENVSTHDFMCTRRLNKTWTRNFVKLAMLLISRIGIKGYIYLIEEDIFLRFSYR